MKKHSTKIIDRSLSFILSTALVLSPILGTMTNKASVQATATGILVNYHSKEELIAYFEQKGITLDYPMVTYSTEPSVTAPYTPGKLSDTTNTKALAMLNAIRYVAGINDNVTINPDYESKAQAAALLNAINRELSHYPDKPEGISDELYSLGSSGASSSNMAMASWGISLESRLLHGWMADASSGNISRVGHRRWILNPAMNETGFGAVESFAAMYAFGYDRTYYFDEDKATPYGVSWPAQTMPLEFFGSSYPWSISMGTTVEEESVCVSLTRKSDGKIWKFSKSSSDGDFYVNNGSYGASGCIIFRPSKASYKDGDVFHVDISGLPQPVSYDVEFFTLKESSSSSQAKEPEADTSKESLKKAVIHSCKRKTGNKVVVSMKSQKDISGFELRYNTKKNKKTATKKYISGTKVTLKNIKKNKTLYLWARAYQTQNGSKVYGKWSKIKKLKPSHS